jgi:putative ABC transport system substrate-binding protein
MRRRAFLSLVGGAAMTPFVARAQQVTPVIGVIGAMSYDTWKRYIAAFLQGLKESGYAEGDNVAIEYRWAEGHYDRLPAMAADLVARKVAVIVPIAPPAILAAKAATQTIPVVFFTGADPVALGIVPNMNRPGGNVTGVSALANAINAKRLQLLREIVPKSATTGMLVNPTNANAIPDTAEVQAAADKMKQPLVVAKASTDADIDAAFASFAQHKVDTLLVNPDPFLLGRCEHIAALALRYRIATIFHLHEPVVAGGLISYGGSFADSHRQAGLYVGRILKGEKPGDLPVVQAVKFETVINRKTAEMLGLKVPSQLLFTADEVIE